MREYGTTKVRVRHVGQISFPCTYACGYGLALGGKPKPIVVGTTSKIISKTTFSTPTATVHCHQQAPLGGWSFAALIHVRMQYGFCWRTPFLSNSEKRLCRSISSVAARRLATLDLSPLSHSSCRRGLGENAFRPSDTHTAAVSQAQSDVVPRVARRHQKYSETIS